MALQKRSVIRKLRRLTFGCTWTPKVSVGSGSVSEWPTTRNKSVYDCLNLRLWIQVSQDEGGKQESLRMFRTSEDYEEFASYIRANTDMC